MKMTFHRASAWIPALLAAALLPACKSIDVPKVPGVTPYRMVIQQGNFISQEMVAQLKPGMTKEQVRFILGTPLVTDIFHADRWDYVFFRELANGKRDQRNLSVVFEKEKLVRVLGDLMPSDGAVQAGGFDPQLKPDAKPAAKPAPKPEAKPVAQAPEHAAEAAKPEPEAVPAPKPDEDKTAEEKKSPGFFERLREKIGL
ncbi:MAG: outer membrane protein assembly factor BamE [Betaproteobacteria bacterium]